MKNDFHTPASLANRLRIFLLVFMAAVAFHNTLQNDLIGDDKALFGKNRFYKSLGNFPKVFSRDVVMNTEDFQVGGELESFSGCVSYRPVPAATFFVDYALWKGNPAGHHLTNIFLHLLVVVFAFFFFLRLTSNPPSAFFAAALFAVHPVQTEAVNTIGYRSDILMAFFSLAVVLSYWRWLTALTTQKNKWLALCALFYFLALFSKETALVLPALVFILNRFECVPPQGSASEARWSGHKAISLICLLITIGYLYVYFFMMPNAVYLQNAPQAQTGFAKLIVGLKTLTIYLGALILPSGVSLLPPMYAPSVYPLEWWEIALPLGFVLASGVVAWKYRRRNKIISLGILWFWLTYLPVSGIVPLLNPLAYRFLYLPSLGFFLVVAAGIEALCQTIRQAKVSPNIPFLLKGAIIGLCIALTIATNSFYLNNIVACREMVRRYPDSSRPYWILGLEYYRLGRFGDSAQFLLQHLAARTNNPFISDDKEKFLTYHLLGIATQDPDAAIRYLKKAAEIYPGLVQLSLDLSRNYLIKKDYDTALRYAQNAVERDPGMMLAHVFVVHIHSESGNFPAAHQALDQAVGLFGLTPEIKAVKEHLNKKERTL